MMWPQCTGEKFLEISCHGDNIERFIFGQVRFDRSNTTIQWIIPYIWRVRKRWQLSGIVPFATIQIVIVRNRDDRRLGLRSALSARGKHLLLKCTLCVCVCARAPLVRQFFKEPPSSLSSPRLHLTSGDERTWQMVGERLIVPSSRRGQPRSSTMAETELLSSRITREDKTDKTIFVSFRDFSSISRNFRDEERRAATCDPPSGEMNKWTLRVLFYKLSFYSFLLGEKSHGFK